MLLSFLKRVDRPVVDQMNTSMKPIEDTAKDSIHKLILTAIMNGEIDMKDPISERGIAERFSVGRSKVREALRDLINDGILSNAPARGTFIRELTIYEMREIYEVRYALESMAAHLAAKHGALPELLAYEARFADMRANTASYSLKEIDQYGAEFHIEIFRSARNEKLLQVYQPVRLRLATALTLPRYYEPEWVIKALDEHIQIMKAIIDRDSMLAQTLIVEHMAAGFETRLKIIGRLDGYSPPAFSAPRQEPDAKE